MTVTDIACTSSNRGIHCEQALAFTLTGEIRKHDHVPFHMGSDIPEFNMSVKSSGFTLASGKINMGETFDEKLADFFGRVHSDKFAYVTVSMVAYIMDRNEFEQFLRTFGYMDRDSQKNGGLLKVKCRKESKKMLKWFEARVAA
jgi:hypothetical protein